VVTARFVLATLGSLLIILLLAVPSANAYFRCAGWPETLPVSYESLLVSGSSYVQGCCAALRSSPPPELVRSRLLGDADYPGRDLVPAATRGPGRQLEDR
jgi:hypothetical protein